MAKVRITLVKSTIRCEKSQVATVKALGLKKISSSIEHETTPQILGMIAKVNHLIRVEEVK